MTADYSAIEAVRSARRRQFRDAEGFSLTYLPFVARAVVDALHEYPLMNATVAPTGDGLMSHRVVLAALGVRRWACGDDSRTASCRCDGSATLPADSELSRPAGSHGWNFLGTLPSDDYTHAFNNPGNADPSDPNNSEGMTGHGTAVTGIMAAAFGLDALVLYRRPNIGALSRTG